jgi:MFS transporter, MCT family, solute carrier family 16 (monocarboxylic acid transporters), member 10
MNAANLPGRIIPNHLAGYFGINNLMIISAIVCAAIIFSFVAVHNAAGIIVVAIIYGFASGACELDKS